jgi:hypothetical protein
MTESSLLTSTPPQDGQGGSDASNGSNRSKTRPQSPQRNSYMGTNEIVRRPVGVPNPALGRPAGEPIVSVLWQGPGSDSEHGAGCG